MYVNRRWCCAAFYSESITYLLHNWIEHHTDAGETQPTMSEVHERSLYDRVVWLPEKWIQFRILLVDSVSKFVLIFFLQRFRGWWMEACFLLWETDKYSPWSNESQSRVQRWSKIKCEECSTAFFVKKCILLSHASILPLNRCWSRNPMTLEQQDTTQSICMWWRET